jgi:hypothetical protein
LQTKQDSDEDNLEVTNKEDVQSEVEFESDVEVKSELQMGDLPDLDIASVPKHDPKCPEEERFSCSVC